MRLLHSAFVLASCFALAAPAAGQLRAHRLDNGTVTVLASEAAGGRLLSFALAGRPNFLLVDEGAGNPDAVSVSPFSNNVPYLGHEVWVGGGRGVGEVVFNPVQDIRSGVVPDAVQRSGDDCPGVRGHHWRRSPVR